MRLAGFQQRTIGTRSQGRSDVAERWQVLITDRLEALAVQILEPFAQVEWRPGIDGALLLKALAKADGLIVRGRMQVTADRIAAAPRLKVIGRAGVGLDNIDLPAATERGIIVVNSPAATTVAVAEHTLGLMFALARQIPRADAGLRRGRWLKEKIRGIELQGKSLGLVGLGRIGLAVAQRASALGMRCLGYDPLYPSLSPPPGEVELVALETLLGQADFVSLHVPLSAQTRGMLDAARLKLMKPEAFLICTARGGLIDERALLTALNSGKLAGAGLDVFAEEPPGRDPLLSHELVVATPHVAGQTIESQERAARDVAEEVLAVLRGQNPRWRAN